MTKNNHSHENGTISEAGADEYEGNIVLTKDQLATVSKYADEAFQLKAKKTTFDESIKAYAKANSIRPADLKDMINIVNKEREKGGTLEERERKLEIAREIVDKLGVKKDGPRPQLDLDSE